MKVCSVPGCPHWVKARGRCTEHLAQYSAERGDPPGLHQHRKTRARLLPLAIGKPCPICHQPMLDPNGPGGRPLDLDHTVPRAVDPTSKGDRIVHASCNRRRGGQLNRGRGKGL